MRDEKKIELQNKIIHNLQEENIALKEQIKELEKVVNDNKNIVEAAEVYRKEHEECIASLRKARDEYLQAHQEIMEYKEKYKRDMKNLFKTVKKNI